jgi:hypothetical protein
MCGPFTCPICGAVSHNRNDAVHRYCGRCHVFVDDEINRRPPEEARMQITIKPTEKFFLLGDVMVRAWTGTTDAGEAVVALVSAVQIATDVDIPGLVSIPPPDRKQAEEWAAKIQRGEIDFS